MRGRWHGQAVNVDGIAAGDTAVVSDLHDSRGGISTAKQRCHVDLDFPAARVAGDGYELLISGPMAVCADGCAQQVRATVVHVVRIHTNRSYDGAAPLTHKLAVEEVWDGFVVRHTRRIEREANARRSHVEEFDSDIISVVREPVDDSRLHPADLSFGGLTRGSEHGPVVRGAKADAAVPLCKAQVLSRGARADRGDDDRTKELCHSARRALVVTKATVSRCRAPAVDRRRDGRA